MRRVLFVSVIAALGVLGAGCSDDSGSGTETTSKTTSSTTTVQPTTTTTVGQDEGHGEPGHQHMSTTAPAPGPNMMSNPNGDGSWVPCEGTICTNPNHGGGDSPNTTETAEMGTPVPATETGAVPPTE
ncbi:hypothetical protein ACWZHB_26905 [Nocardia sp. FBN12]|uniref:hypothetical protein n=1 Tax=Nocardia sp. FBN12 TaxID=3419766 RepID=UPI003D020D40